MDKPAADIARRLADKAEDVCRYYLSKGRREGAYWLIGDIRNTPGRSLYVRLTGSEDGRSRPGKWTDAANGDHGDLLDLIAARSSALSLRDTLAEARRFLSMPPPPSRDNPAASRASKPPRATPEAARKRFGAARPIAGTVVEAYLRKRALTDLRTYDPLRFDPRCWYRPAQEDAPGVRNTWPAMIAAITDLRGEVTGIHRTWLDPATIDKASIAQPRRTLGPLLGNGVRFGAATDVMAAGEGLETTLSLREAMPALPLIAALSSGHLGAVLFPSQLRRLYVARDPDPAGDAALRILTQRAQAEGIELVALSPALDDFNADLRHRGVERLKAHLRTQLAPPDVARFLIVPK